MLTHQCFPAVRCGFIIWFVELEFDFGCFERGQHLQANEVLVYGHDQTGLRQTRQLSDCEPNSCIWG